MGSATPVQIGTGAWTAVASGHDFTCGVRSDGSLWCWGDNAYLQLGTVATDNAPVGVRVGPGTGWTGVSAGLDFTCATTARSTLWCWGNNLFGQLGTALPVPVIRPVA